MAATLMQAFLNAGAKPVKPRKQRDRKTQVCRKCNGPMKFLEGTNVMICPNDIAITDKVTGEVKSVPCGNKFIFSNFK